MSSNFAFLFLKPNISDNEKVRALVQRLLKERDIKVIEEGEIPSEKIKEERLIDKHYYAIASKAVLLKPGELHVPSEKFKNKFSISWEEALENGLCLNAEDAGKLWGLDAKKLEKKWRDAERNDRAVKFGGGFYCAEIDGYFVFNGFFMAMREDYIAPGKMIYYFKVQWSSNELSWKGFRLEILGKTDPSVADKDSIRGLLYTQWEKLGLSQKPGIGSNGIHGSASAFEALIEQMNWCGDELKENPFGRMMIGAGVTEELMEKWKTDPQVVIDEDWNKGSIFDMFEDMDSKQCVDAAIRIQTLDKSSEKSCG